ncbi:20619_t:CDS:1, partial [Funneliformis geosporum]
YKFVLKRRKELYNVLCPIDRNLENESDCIDNKIELRLNKGKEKILNLRKKYREIDNKIKSYEE